MAFLGSTWVLSRSKFPDQVARSHAEVQSHSSQSCLRKQNLISQASVLSSLEKKYIPKVHLRKNHEYQIKSSDFLLMTSTDTELRHKLETGSTTQAQKLHCPKSHMSTKRTNVTIRNSVIVGQNDSLVKTETVELLLRGL